MLASIDELRERQPSLASVLVTHHLEELPASTSHALLLRDGRMVAAGTVSEVLTTELVSAYFDYPVAIARHAGRWASIAGKTSQAEVAGASASRGCGLAEGERVCLQPW